MSEPLDLAELARRVSQFHEPVLFSRGVHAPFSGRTCVLITVAERDALVALGRAAMHIESFAPFDPARGLPHGFIAAINDLNDAVRGIVDTETKEAP